MAIRSLTINGLRGFASPQKISFAEPNNTVGSGLTMLVGPNNEGKSTVIEAICAFGFLCHTTT
jgi:DNA repair exonuclease SbcCD ATPase subunit